MYFIQPHINNRTVGPCKKHTYLYKYGPILHNYWLLVVVLGSKHFFHNTGGWEYSIQLNVYVWMSEIIKNNRKNERQTDNILGAGENNSSKLSH